MNININVNEALRYLGCNKTNDELAAQAQKCINEIREIMTPRWTYGIFPISPDDNGVKFLDSDIYFKSRDLAKLLKYSKKCIVMGVTLGIAIDKAISLYEKTDMSKAVIFDACSSAAVEGLCDYVTEIIKSDNIVNFLTMRYSAGYGDLDISVQKQVLDMLNAYKKIGLTSTPSMLLTPSKSVTAIIGMTDRPYMASANGCEFCRNNKACMYRKTGKTCSY